MKKIVLVCALGLATLVSSMSAQAQTVITGNFNVRVNLTPVCQITTNTNATSTSTGTTDLIFNYTSFGAAQNPSSTFLVKCTDTLSYTLALDGTGFGGTTTALGLSYSLALAAPAAPGTGADQTYTINGTMAAGQAGTCATPAGCTNTALRTITLTY